MDKKNHTLLVEKYRPHSLDTYIVDPEVKKIFQNYIDKKDIPNLLFHGTPGCGKTTIAKILAEHVSPNNVLYINASNENSVDTVREKIDEFVSTVSFDKQLKIVVLDEADFLSASAQAALRGTTEYFSQTARFILTCNYPEKIIDALRSRCHSFELSHPKKIDIAKMVCSILDEEKIEYEKTDVANIILSFYPDIRKIIHSAQQSILDNKLVVRDDIINQQNYIAKIVEILSDVNKKPRTKITEIRTIFAENYIRDYAFLFRHLYENMDKYSNGKIVEVISLIAEAQYKDGIVRDKEINAAALLYSIIDITKGTTL